MKSYRPKARRSSDDPVASLEAEVKAERRRMNKDLLQELALTVAANERAQRRFRIAVLMRLSRIETMVAMIHATQFLEAVRREPGREQKIRERVNDAEDYAFQHGKELFVEMVKYIYDGPEAIGVRVGTRRKRRA